MISPSWPILIIPSLYNWHDILWGGTSVWPVQIRCPSPALSWLLVNPLAVRAWKTEKSLMSKASTTEEKTKHVGVLSTLFSYWIQNTALATRKKVYSIPAEKKDPCLMSECLSTLRHALSMLSQAFRESTGISEYCFCCLLCLFSGTTWWLSLSINVCKFYCLLSGVVSQ